MNYDLRPFSHSLTTLSVRYLKNALNSSDTSTNKPVFDDFIHHYDKNCNFIMVYINAKLDDQIVCAYCHNKTDKLTKDHIVPKKWLKDNNVSDVVLISLCCQRCNIEKGCKSLRQGLIFDHIRNRSGIVNPTNIDMINWVRQLPYQS